MSLRSLCVVSTLVLPWALASPVARGEVMVTLSSPDDLSQLKVGDEFRVDVNLTGVDVGNNFIFVLNTRVLFPSSLVQVVADPGTSSGLSPGAILVTADQRTAFDLSSSLSSGQAIGNFSDTSPLISQAIAQNGIYYSFVLRAMALGSGVVQFDPSGGNAYAANDTNFDLRPVATGGSLRFHIIPEPASLTLAGIAAGFGVFLRATRGRGSR